ncbi:hypothetical protein MMC14_006428 [Varicellaria rhodocarpa]|nr:hypothetical protein [Varicellaria rhodocarpa]
MTLDSLIPNFLVEARARRKRIASNKRIDNDIINAVQKIWISNGLSSCITRAGLNEEIRKSGHLESIIYTRDDMYWAMVYIEKWAKREGFEKTKTPGTVPWHSEWTTPGPWAPEEGNGDELAPYVHSGLVHTVFDFF